MSDFLEQAKTLIAQKDQATIAQKDQATIARFLVQIDQILGSEGFLAGAAKQMHTTKPLMKKTLLLAKELLEDFG